MSTNKLSTAFWVRHWLISIGLASYYLVFAIRHLDSWLTTGQVASLLIVVLEAVAIVIILSRRPEKTITNRPIEWLAAVGGTIVPLAFIPGGSVLIDPRLGTWLVMGGIVISILGLLSLNRSIGVVPADRGIQTAGLYHMVRHPIYTGYLVTFGGYLLVSASLVNVLAYSSMVVLLVARVVYEERHLEQNDEYARYMKRVKWRLAPGIY